jgi:hypothetical protein
MKMLDEITSEQIAQHYTAMGHSVALINDIIAGDAMADDTSGRQARLRWIVTLDTLRSWLPKTSGQAKI